MLRQCNSSTSFGIDNRVFVYEVTGLSQNEMTARQQPPIRSSQNQFFQVPFARMNEEMRRITLLGGEIVNIFPLGAEVKASQNKQSQNEQAEEKQTEEKQTEEKRTGE